MIKQTIMTKCIDTPSITSEVILLSFKYGTFCFKEEKKFPRKSVIVYTIIFFLYIEV